MAREARKLYLILGSLKSLPTIILLGVDSVVTANALIDQVALCINAEFMMLYYF